MKPQEITAQEMHDLMVDAHEAWKFFKANVFPEPYQSKNLIGLEGYKKGKFKAPKWKVRVGILGPFLFKKKFYI